MSHHHLTRCRLAATGTAPAAVADLAPEVEMSRRKTDNTADNGKATEVPPPPGLPPTELPKAEQLAAPDPFDPAKLRLLQDFGAAAGVKKLLTTVPVRKPAKEWFVRTHPDEAFRLHTAVLELKEDREVYLVCRELLTDLAGESTISPRLLVTTITRQGVLFLWPLRLPGVDGKFDDWGRSALEAAEAARTRWVRITANTIGAGSYDLYTAAESLSPPEWPDTPFRKLLKVAFKDKFIESLDHPVLRRLRGEV
jgi:hypothetical protein